MGKLNKRVSATDKLLLIGGVIHSKMAFIGPQVLHIDLTNLCNFNCVACWCRSPLLGEKAMPEWERKLTLPMGLLKELFNDLAAIKGLKQVKLVGGGEPFMHPQIFEIVKYIKEKDASIQIDINTNFSLVGNNEADRLLKLGVDSLTVSVWAGTPEVYAALHPNQTKETFQKIKKTLEYIFSKKQETGTKRPLIRIHDVIMNINYRDINRMIGFGFEVGADEIQFVPLDPIKDKTESLLLKEEEKKELLGILYAIRQQYDPGSFCYTPPGSRGIRLPDFDGFIHRIEKLNIYSGAYDEERIKEVPCYVGWLFARVMTTGDVVPCCKGHRMVMGNLYKDSFRKIWNSKKYREFRYKAKNLQKGDPYFLSIGNTASNKTGCYNCDNLWQNEPMHSMIMSLPWPKRRPLF
ncbi:radical SAM protein [bacterium]|nr:MAG: radical SAM protein [bacterium]